MTGLIALWSHLLAAALYGGLAIWQLRRWAFEPQGRPLVTAFAVMAVWSIFLGTFGPYHFLSQLSDSARHLAFLSFMYGLLGEAADPHRDRPVKMVYAAVAAVIALQIVIAGLLPEFAQRRVVFEALTSVSDMIGFTIAAGALVLVHNLYGQADVESRGRLRLTAIALSAMWAYDLHLYTVAFLTRDAGDLFAMRGAVVAMIVPLFAAGLRRTGSWKVQVSRAATFQSVSVLAILVYLILMMAATRTVEAAGGDWVRIGEIGLVFAMSVVGFILLPSARARRWAAVVLQKHFFEHRYDYRQEWLRFTHTVGSAGADAAPLDERVVKALADIAGAPAGLLLTRGDGDRLAPAGGWNWQDPLVLSRDDDGGFARFIESSGHVVDFGALANGILAAKRARVRVPAWLAEMSPAWAGVPLIHGGRLLGLVVLAHSSERRPLDWEDFDLFRTAGMQAASYLAEARSQEALADAQRFEEFSRRFAFIMHDIKNLVSQLSLVARNAERHADNPEFRADMIATLQSSVRKMNDLLARLSRKAVAPEPPRPVMIAPMLGQIAEPKRRQHPIELAGDARLSALADRAGLEQALGHLVQNAIDASPVSEPVRVTFFRQRGEVAIQVSDNGCGMSAEFIRTRLFQPFSSTKESGFGVGAHEARALIETMGGRIEVESREGEGSRFTIFLPAAPKAAAQIPDRMTA